MFLVTSEMCVLEKPMTIPESEEKRKSWARHENEVALGSERVLVVGQPLLITCPCARVPRVREYREQ